MFIMLFNLRVVNIEPYQTSVVVMEKESGRVLYGEDIHVVHLTASISKIMTAIVAIENGDLDKYYKVDKKSTLQEGSSIYLKLDDEIKLIDLIYGLMLQSGNDAAYQIAISVGKDANDFVRMMNNKAKELNMHNSVFNNPSGLDEEIGNYSTAYDMALLMRYAMNNKIFRKVTSSRSYVATSKQGKYYFYNKHRLIYNGEAIGGKTGYTKKAKRTLVSCFKKDNMELIVVSFDMGNDFNTHKALSNQKFNEYKNINLFKRGILDLHESKYTPYIHEDITYPINDNERLKCKIYLLNNPKDDIIGKITILIDDKVVKEVMIYRYS